MRKVVYSSAGASHQHFEATHKQRIFFHPQARTMFRFMVDHADTENAKECSVLDR